MTTYINVHQVESVDVEHTNHGDFKTITIKVKNDEGVVEFTIFTYDHNLGFSLTGE